jgi:hypothetical protein
MLVDAFMATFSTLWGLRKVGTSSLGILFWVTISPFGLRIVA